jgi:hypothetical protein
LPDLIFEDHIQGAVVDGVLQGGLDQIIAVELLHASINRRVVGYKGNGLSAFELLDADEFLTEE